MTTACSVSLSRRMLTVDRNHDDLLPPPTDTHTPTHIVPPWTTLFPPPHDLYDAENQILAQTMSEQFPSTLRPVAPGRLRRTLAEKPSDTPPPPYETPELDLAFPHKRTISHTDVSSNVASPVTATAQLLGIDLDGQREGDRTITEEFVSESSRDELTRLLLKAEAVIRARERGAYVPTCACFPGDPRPHGSTSSDILHIR